MLLNVVDMELPSSEPATIFYVGHHETDQTEAVSNDVLGQAQDLGYDFLTAAITTPAFQNRVIDLVRDYQSQPSDNLPLISPLTPSDSTLTPDESNATRIAVSSPWIDLASTDPVIAYVSRQVFNLEVAYAAFCGINNVIVRGPTEDGDAVQFARAVQEAIGLGPYLQLHLLMPMSVELESETPDGTYLGELATTNNEEMVELGGKDDYDVWERWDTIRTLCSYSQKLSLGTKYIFALLTHFHCAS